MPAAARRKARRRFPFLARGSLGGNLPDGQRKAVDKLLFPFLPFEDSPMGIWFKAVSRYLSPYDFNSLNINPLKELITLSILTP